MDEMIKPTDQISNNPNYISTDTNIIGYAGISIESVSGAIDKFQEETDARKKDVNDLKGSLFITRQDLLDIITKNHEQFTKEIHEIKKALVSYMIITLFLTVGFIYCILAL